ncbi:30S ribosomal protein S17 [Mucisphaera sp.]|uniref:30S ribosomal protein S17 n=1 Tax=Mucisphaera sp. TaxID=2913024 RepID=UPI003D0CEC1D
MTTASKTTKRELTGTKIGVVTSDKRDKTRTVEVDFQFRHPKYGKYIHRQLRFHIHDEENASKTGDRVEIAPCRPYSKTKSWRLLRILESAPDAE